MEISTFSTGIKACFECLYFPFWAIISFTCLDRGLDALHRTGLSESVPPVIMFFFTHTFTIFVLHSSDYRLVHTKHPANASVYCSLIFFFLFIPLLLSTFDKDIPSNNCLNMGDEEIYIFLTMSIFFTIFIPGTLSDGHGTVGDWISCILNSSMKFRLIVYKHSWKFMPVLALLISGITSFIWAASAEYEMLPVSERGNTNITSRSNNKKWKLFRFAIGTGMTALFQYFFRLTSFDHVLAFLYLSTAWLGNIALVQSTDDLGVFKFLLGNVIIGSTVGQSGIGSKTWIVYGVSVFLYAVRLLLKERVLV